MMTRDGKVITGQQSWFNGCQKESPEREIENIRQTANEINSESPRPDQYV